jgi:alanine racemase
VTHFPLRLRIDGAALVANWRWLAQQGGGAACGAAVKADGYGLGARETVNRLAAAGCRDFFVATWAEAEALMPWPEELALSVLHGVGKDDLPDALASPARPVLNSASQVARWREAAPGRSCDVMIDTGMNRLGLSDEEARSGLLEGLVIDTLMSHLACADDPQHPLNLAQLLRFQSLSGAVPARRASLANSAGICLGPAYAFDLTRPGLALYGGIPVAGDSRQERAIQPVVSVEAQLLQLRHVLPGETVGYGATFVAGSPLQIGILNIGYADGYLRQLGPYGRVRANGHVFAIAGRVSMDLIAVDLSHPIGGQKLDHGEVAEGDWLTLDYRLPELAEASGLSQYELLTGLGSRFERVWS